MQKIVVNGELLFCLASKQDWVNKVPGILPEKIRIGETRIWIDANGNVFECGADFSAAEKGASYPCHVYRLQNVAAAVPVLTGPKPVITKQFVTWLQEQHIEDQEVFTLQSLYEIYINSICWEELSADPEIPTEHLKVRV